MIDVKSVNKASDTNPEEKEVIAEREGMGNQRRFLLALGLDKLIAFVWRKSPI